MCISNCDEMDFNTIVIPAINTWIEQNGNEMEKKENRTKESEIYRIYRNGINDL